jgi:nitrile hydratase
MYRPGDRVRVSTVDPDHHTRVPRYVRGHVGVVVSMRGRWPLADALAQGVRDSAPEPVYTVRLSARDLWGRGGHDIHVDLWESYLREADNE